MELFSIILIILNLLILFSFFIFHKRIKNSIKEKLEKYKFSKEQNIDKKYEELLNKKQQEYSERINKLNEELKEKQELYKNIIEQNESIIKNEEEKKNLILNQKQEIIDKELENYKIQQIQKLQQNLNIKETELNNQLFQFKEKIEEDKKEALDILNSILEELEDISVVKINTEEHTDLAVSFGVMSIPTLILFKDGEQVGKKVGFMNKEELESWINSLK